MRIIVVDDDLGSRTSVARFLKTMGHKVDQFSKAEEALAALGKAFIPIVLSDIKMPEMSGLDLLREVSRLPAETRPKVVLFTGHGSLESAIEALRMGAYDYLLKPVKAEELMAVIHKICSSPTPATGATVKQKAAADLSIATEVLLDIGEKIYVFSPPMRQAVLQALQYHEDRSLPILIQGETGTGKELIARLIHTGGKQAGQPFIGINCAAISPGLFESELFGYAGASFTGGKGKDQEGKFDIARQGTIFLDEVAEIPLDLQAKLLRVVEEREYYRVGGLKKLPVEARIICATNVDLRQAVDEGKFRLDLYYRLQGGEILLPPLRARAADILPLATRFLLEYSRQRQKHFTKVSNEAEKLLLQYSWPGNIRELRNLIRRAVFMYDEEELTPRHLAGTRLVTDRGPSQPEASPNLLEQDGSLIERHVDQLVQDAIRNHNGNKAAAARYLGISRRSLYRLLERSNP